MCIVCLHDGKILVHCGDYVSGGQRQVCSKDSRVLIVVRPDILQWAMQWVDLVTQSAVLRIHYHLCQALWCLDDRDYARGRGRDISVICISSWEPSFESRWGLDSGHPMHEREGRILPDVKVILHQLALLKGVLWIFLKKPLKNKQKY